jgi:putative membrane protein
LLFWTTVVVLFVLFGRRWRRRQDGETTLADVFARGEITEAEYRSRLAVLRENRR